MIDKQAVRKIKQLCHVGDQVAGLLLTLAGGDVDLVVSCSRRANGLDQCKAFILDERIAKTERRLDVV